MPWRITKNEHTAALALLRQGLPMALIVEILLMNRQGGASQWRQIRDIFTTLTAATTILAYTHPRIDMLHVFERRNLTFLILYTLLRYTFRDRHTMSQWRRGHITGPLAPIQFIYGAQTSHP